MSKGANERKAPVKGDGPGGVMFGKRENPRLLISERHHHGGIKSPGRIGRETLSDATRRTQVVSAGRMRMRGWEGRGKGLVPVSQPA